MKEVVDEFQELIDYMEADALSSWVIMRDANSACRKEGKPELHSAKELENYDRVSVALDNGQYDEAVMLYVSIFPDGQEMPQGILTDLLSYASKRGLDLQKLKTFVPFDANERYRIWWEKVQSNKSSA